MPSGWSKLFGQNKEQSELDGLLHLAGEIELAETHEGANTDMELVRDASSDNLDLNHNEGSDPIQQGQDQQRPFDVFVVHTGAQKNHAVAMAAFFRAEQGSDATTQQESEAFPALRCFIDVGMRAHAVAPTEQMRRALETCRHAVILISAAFLIRRRPVDECRYAFRRFMWQTSLAVAVASFSRIYVLLVPFI